MKYDMLNNFDFTGFDSLGFMYPFYVKINENYYIDHLFSNVIKNLSSELRIIDPAAVIEFINRNYFLGDRSIIQNINRTPWIAKLSISNKDWEYKKLNVNVEIKNTQEEIADVLFKKLQKEILNFCDGKNHVGILLTGGMDSRITAGVLKFLIDSNQLDIIVTAVTWGMENSRDVIYAKRISDHFGWNWKWFPITPEVLENNINITAKNGCEYSPIHLHAMSRLREMNEIDCILATSYGDSIGRGEYSGEHASVLSPIKCNLKNKYSIIKINTFEKYKREICSDLKKYRIRYPQVHKHQQNELDMQIHYMRRMFNSCFGFVNEKIPVHQVFSSPDIYEFILKQDIRLRNNAIYYHLLQNLDDFLLKLPWARNGQTYLSEGGESDNYSKEYHQYGKWIRNDLSSIIEKKVFSDNITNLNIFNIDSLRSVFEANKLVKTNNVSKFDSLLIWIASVSDMITLYNIKGLDMENSSLDIIRGRYIARCLSYSYIVPRVILKKL